MRAFFETIGDIATWTFGFLPAAGNIINNFFMVVIVVAFAYWMLQMIKYQKAGER